MFSVPQMSRAWRATVRTGLRRQPLSDLHDFLDVHRNMTPYLEALRSEVPLRSVSRPSPPEIMLLEKRGGIPRRLVLPSAGRRYSSSGLWSMFLRGRSELISPIRTSYYSQSHAPPDTDPEEVDGTSSRILGGFCGRDSRNGSGSLRDPTTTSSSLILPTTLTPSLLPP